MKFAQHLSAHITPEWRKQYITYEEMKVMLYSAMEELPNDEHMYGESFVHSFDRQFMSYCEKELSKINTFFAEKLAEAIRKFSNLKSELSEQHISLEIKTKEDKILGILDRQLRPLVMPKERRKENRTLSDLKLAFSEFYLSLVLIQNYQNLNFTGFRKILKKHDKLMSTSSGIEWRKQYVDVSHFYTNKDVDKLIEETENLFTTALERGDRQKAMKRLRVPPFNVQQSLWTTFRVGFFLGSFLVLFAAVILAAIYNENHFEWTIVYRLYRAPLLLVVFLFLIGVNVYGWRTSGVNHVLIFELDPRDHLCEQHLFEIASIFAVLWSLSILGYLFSPQLAIPSHIFPLVLLLIMITFLVNPTKTFKHRARFWLLKVLSRVIRAPFVKVNFADFWLADQFNSLVPIILDFEYMTCYYFNLYAISSKHNGNLEDCLFSRDIDLLIRTIVACLPAWFRFAQCIRRYKDDSRGVFPHLINAGKYSTTFFVVIFSTLTKFTTSKYDHSLSNPFFVFWIISMMGSSCYTYIWDIKMDWGFFDFKHPSRDYPFLREEIVYSSPNYYYFAIIEDLILRFGWTLSVSLTEIGVIHGDVIVSILAPLELFRRFIWNFFRLENEHLNNCGEFRAVRDISIAPINKRMDSNINDTNVDLEIDGLDKDNKDVGSNANDSVESITKSNLNKLYNQRGEIYLNMKSLHSNDMSRNTPLNSNKSEISLLLDDGSELNQL